MKETYIYVDFWKFDFSNFLEHSNIDIKQSKNFRSLMFSTWVTIIPPKHVSSKL